MVAYCDDAAGVFVHHFVFVVPSEASVVGLDVESTSQQAKADQAKPPKPKARKRSSSVFGDIVNPSARQVIISGFSSPYMLESVEDRRFCTGHSARHG